MDSTKSIRSSSVALNWMKSIASVVDVELNKYCNDEIVILVHFTI